MILVDRIQIMENGLSAPLRLSADDVQAINTVRFVPPGGDKGKQVFSVVFDGIYGSRIRARDIVGIVRIGRIEIHVVPKCGAGKLAELLNRSLSRVYIDPNLVSASNGDLRQYIASQFLDLFERLTASGLDEGYVRTSDLGSSPKGRIDFSWFGSGLQLPIRYSYERFTSDIVENQLLCAALDHIVHMFGRGHVLGSRAYRLRDALEVSRFDGSDYRGVVERSSYSHLVPCLSLGAFILENGGVEPQAGNFASSGLLFWMPHVYEGFICSVVKDIAGSIGLTYDAQGVLYDRFLGVDNRLRIHPDFALWREGECLLVGDVKYKRRKRGAPRADLYQMFAYQHLTAARQSLLVYAGAGEDYDLSFNGTDSAPLKAISVDVDVMEVADIELQVHQVISDLVDASQAG